MRVTLKAINERLAADGCGARVERGDGVTEMGPWNQGLA